MSMLLESPEPRRIASDNDEPTSRPRTVRVLHLINGEHYSGAERVQDLLAMHLPELGFDVGFACLKPGRFASARKSCASPVYATPMRSRFDMSVVARVSDIVREHGYAVIHTHTPRAAIVGRTVARRLRLPLVHHVHSPTTADSTHTLRNRLNAWIEGRTMRRANAVIAVSGSLAQYALRQGVSERKVIVVPNGVPVMGPLPQRQTPKDNWTLGVVALFRPRKGLEILLESLAQLRGRSTPARLLAVGGFETPDYEQGIHALAHRLGVASIIEWTGFTTNVAAQLAKMDLFVLPSLFGEGLPMVVLEAMAAGVPVVGTRVEGVPEAIRHGLDGLIASPGSATDLSHCIDQIVRGQAHWSRLRASAHARQAEKFSDIAMATGIANVYSKVLGA